MRVWDAFCQKLTEAHGLNPRAALHGCSRGAFFVYAVAGRWPERVAVIHGDTPVMDFTSWPEGKDGTGTRSEADWERLKRVYGFASDAEAEAYGGLPLNTAERLAKARLPIWHTVSAEERLVPPKHNAGPFARRVRAAGGKMAIHWDKGPYSLQGHHFPLDAVDATVRFIEANTPLPDLPADRMSTWARGAALRPALDRIAGVKKAHAVFLGGAITQNHGWQDLVFESLRRRFPGVALGCVNAGIASLGSLSHAFRWRRHFGGPADLVFFEAAVNGLHNGQTAEETERAYEGVIRGILSENPQVGPVCLHFAEPRHTADHAQGKTPAVIARQARIAAHYGVAQANLAKEVADRLAAGRFDWARDFRDLHPSPFGQRLYFNAVRRLAGRRHPRAHPNDGAPLPTPLRADRSARGDFLLGVNAKDLNGYEAIPSWRPDPPGETRRRFVAYPLLKDKGEGASFAFDFTGPTLGAYVISGPEAVALEWSVDGGLWQTKDTWPPWSGHIHVPWHLLLATDLPEGPHTVRFHARAKKGRDTLLFCALMVTP